LLLRLSILCHRWCRGSWRVTKSTAACADHGKLVGEFTGHVGQVEDNGVLKITPDDQDSPIIRLSPAFWRQIKEPRGEVGFAFYAAER
jgi:hypothetical protein